MKTCKISDVADIQSGLVLSRKVSKTNTGLHVYRRLTLRSITDESLLDMSSIEPYAAAETIDNAFLTRENDIIIRLFAPPRAVLIKKEQVGLVVPSQLAIVRVKEQSAILPGYLSAYLSNERCLENLMEGAGAAAQKIIKVGSVADMEIPCLPEEKQKIISYMADEQLNILALYKNIAKQEALRTKRIIKDIIGGIR